MAGESPGRRANGSGLTGKQQHDPLQWMRHYWEQQTDDDPTGFLAMTSVLRLHHLMTTSVDRTLRAEAGISLTEFQILKAMELSETGTWLLSRMAWHLMVHATTVTLSVERLESKQLVKRVSHPSDRRASLIEITEDGRKLVDRATRALAAVDFGLPGLSASQARSMISAIARVRAVAGDEDRSYGSAPSDRD
ncbi:MAG TPA: MarR family winged helix-turn-helix transcriptional regulator [Mycobacterium sp.]|nr:MarR family winged helix-turn-helix transcriptional regulator [Mycobacterium sp.]